jgi:hypothetical protein
LIFRDWEFVLFYYGFFGGAAGLGRSGAVHFHPLNNGLVDHGVQMQILHMSDEFPLFYWSYDAKSAVQIKNVFDKHFGCYLMPPKNTLVILKLDNIWPKCESAEDRLDAQR